MSDNNSKPEQMIIAVSAGALFDLHDEKEIIKKQSYEAYTKYMWATKDEPLKPGAAFRFVQKITRFNNGLDEDGRPVRIILYTGNNQVSGARVLNSINHYQLNVSTGALMCSNIHNIDILRIFNPDLYLTTNEDLAIKVAPDMPVAVMGRPCTGNLPVASNDNSPLHIVYDFDGCLVDPSADIHYANGGLKQVIQNESGKSIKDFAIGPHMRFFRRFAWLQDCLDNNNYKMLTFSLATARSLEISSRVIDTINQGIAEQGYRPLYFDNILMLQGWPKRDFLAALKPDIFFDDSKKIIDEVSSVVNAGRVIGSNYDASAPRISDNITPRRAAQATAPMTMALALRMTPLEERSDFAKPENGGRRQPG